MSEEHRIRVLMTKVGLDGHDRGIKVISSLLREAGMEVIYLGMFQTPEMIVKAALEEDVDVIGVSCLSGEHMGFIPRIAELLKERGAGEILLLVGGVIPWEDIPALREAGVNEVFPAGSLTEPIVQYIRSNVRASARL